MENDASSSPLFTAQEAFCYYTISDFYASSPRHLYYALLIATLVTRWHGWLLSALLGAAATYAGTASIHAFILLAGRAGKYKAGPVTIPYITPSNALSLEPPSLVTGKSSVVIQPAAVELDTDAVLAVVVTGYLVFLPMQCWSRVARRGRARYFLILLWSTLMLCGTACALVLRPKAYDIPTQHMFCYPEFPPSNPDANEGWPPEVNFMMERSSWNTTVWNIFSNRTLWESLADNCFYPCFSTRQVLRKPDALRAKPFSDLGSVNRRSHDEYWEKYVYSIVVASTVANVFLLALDLSRYESRIPYSDPRRIWHDRGLIYTRLTADTGEVWTIFENWRSSCRIKPWCRTILTGIWIWHSVLLDIIILGVLLSSMVLAPVALVAFVIWIEWNIAGDGPTMESAEQIGQWAPSVAIALVLVSAMVLQLRYRVATKSEIEDEIEEVKQHLMELEAIVKAK